MKAKLKEIMSFFILLFVIANILSFFRASKVQIDDSICKNQVDVVHFWATWGPVC
jgi:hypothetical protein